MQREYGNRGLVCVSVSVAPTDNAQESLEFLTKQNASFPNFLIAEDEELWQKKWNLNGPPAVFVFDRTGRRAAKFDNNDPDNTFTPADVERVVKELLKTP